MGKQTTLIFINILKYLKSKTRYDYFFKDKIFHRNNKSFCKMNAAKLKAGREEVEKREAALQ